MLFGIIYAMIEAGKPENWAWMGFDDPAAQTDQKDQTSGDEISIEGFEGQVYDVTGPREPLDSSTVKFGEQESTGDESTGNETTEENSTALNTDQSGQANEGAAEEWQNFDLTAANRKEFWRQVFRRLDRKERLTFYELVQAAANQQEFEQDESIALTIKKIGLLRRSYHAKMLEAMVTISDQQAAQQISYSELLFELQQAWQHDIEPTLDVLLNNETLSEEQQSQAEWLAAMLQNTALEEIKDSTSGIRDVELPAWSEVTRRLSAATSGQLAEDSVGKVEMNQLMGQTSHYRNKVVSISGQLLLVRKIKLQHRIAEANEVFEMWIAPLGKSVFPFCVYALELPENYDQVGTRTERVSMPVDVDGVMFKKMFYTTEDGEVNECPLILAKVPTIHYEPVQVAESTNLPVWVVATVASLCCLIAIGISVVVFRNSAGRRKFPGRVRKDVDQSLQELEENPSVETVQERLRKLSE